MTALRKGDVVAIIGRVAGVSPDGQQAEVNFHQDKNYSADDVVLLQTDGLRLMEHGDPDYGVKIIEGVEGEWTIQSRLSKNVAVMQRVGSDSDDHDNFQVVAVERLKTQDKDLFRLVTGADLNSRNDAPAPSNVQADEPVEQAQPPVLRAPTLAAPPAAAATVSETAPLTDTRDTGGRIFGAEEAAPPAIPPAMMRPDKIAAPGHQPADSPAAVDASIAQAHSDDNKIFEIEDLSRDPQLGNMVHKAGRLADAREETTQAPSQQPAPLAAPALRTPSLHLSEPAEAKEGRVDLGAIAESSYTPQN